MWSTGQTEAIVKGQQCVTFKPKTFADSDPAVYVSVIFILEIYWATS